MRANRTKIVVTVIVVGLVVAVAAAGHHLQSSPSADSAPVHGGAASVTPRGAAPGSGAQLKTAPPKSSNLVTGSSASTGQATSGAPVASATSAGGDQAKAGQSGLPAVAAVAVAPLVVHTATIDMRVGRGKLAEVLQGLTALATGEGGYIDSSSMSGGTATRSPVAGTVVLRVPDSDFSSALATVAGLGTVEAQSLKGKDVTVQSAENTASITVLQDEVDLLEKQLADTTNTNTFLQIENQLLPVNQQLEQLEAAQAVLSNSATLATVTVNLTAPGTALAAPPAPKPSPGAATVAWRYLRHNSLAVLDALAVGVGWILPVAIPLALLGLVALRVVRRRRRRLVPAA
jgi:uncharacterized protein DUF4349